jgi:hypothetical protein
MADAESGTSDGVPPEDELPTWDDAYLDQVGGRLVHNYDLERDRRVRGEQFALYGEMVIENKKHFLHPSIEIANHHSYEHLFARRDGQVSAQNLDTLVDLGHDLAEEWIDPDEEHYSTEFTFVTVVDRIPEQVRSKVRGLDERTLLKYGYNGHYEVNLVVVAPERKQIVANDAADVETAFRTWETIEREEPGLLQMIARRFQL